MDNYRSVTKNFFSFSNMTVELLWGFFKLGLSLPFRGHACRVQPNGSHDLPSVLSMLRVYLRIKVSQLVGSQLPSMRYVPVT